MIASTRHTYAYANAGKREKLEAFRTEYSRVCLQMFDEIWNNGYGDFSIEKNNLQLPKFLRYKDFNIETDLSGRALQNAVNQAGAIVRSVVEIQKKRNWVEKNKGVKLERVAFSKPNIEFVSPQLNARCHDIRFETGRFAGFVRLRFLGINYGTFKIPIQDTPEFRKWSNLGAKSLKSLTE